MSHGYKTNASLFASHRLGLEKHRRQVAAGPRFRSSELEALAALLSRLDLRPTDEATAELAAAPGASYGLCACDAVHLATAVSAGADRFITNNSSHFSKAFVEVDVVDPSELGDPLS